MFMNSALMITEGIIIKEVKEFDNECNKRRDSFNAPANTSE